MHVYVLYVNVLTSADCRPSFLGPVLLDVAINRDVDVRETCRSLKLDYLHVRRRLTTMPEQIDPEFAPAFADVFDRSDLHARARIAVTSGPSQFGFLEMRVESLGFRITHELSRVERQCHEASQFVTNKRSQNATVIMACFTWTAT